MFREYAMKYSRSNKAVFTLTIRKVFSYLCCRQFQILFFCLWPKFSFECL